MTRQIMIHPISIAPDFRNRVSYGQKLASVHSVIYTYHSVIGFSLCELVASSTWRIFLSSHSHPFLDGSESSKEHEEPAAKVQLHPRQDKPGEFISLQ